MNGFKLTDLQEKWLAELETGGLPQYTGALFAEGRGYCCLGVACLVVGVSPHCGDDDFHLAPNSVIDALHLRVTRFGSQEEEGLGLAHLAAMNDRGKYTFPQIAAQIRDNPQLYFTKGAE